jgi:hypothetical protein
MTPLYHRAMWWWLALAGAITIIAIAGSQIR